MADKLSGVTIIICIALGVLTFVLLFIFAKRQIMRFTIKSKHSPHMPIGHGVSKSLQTEVDRRLLIIKDIAYEPKLLKKNEEVNFTESRSLSQVNPQHLLRMKAVDSLADLEAEIQSLDATRVRKPGQDVRIFFLRQMHSGPLANCDPRLLHKFLDLYEHARHVPKEFGEEQYRSYMNLLYELRIFVSAQNKNIKKRLQKPDIITSPSVNFISSIDPPVSNGKTEPLVSRPTSLSLPDEVQDNDAALETSV